MLSIRWLVTKVQVDISSVYISFTDQSLKLLHAIYLMSNLDTVYPGKRLSANYLED